MSNSDQMNSGTEYKTEVSEQGIHISLEDAGLWRQFHTSGTEMIINRSGRRMFPSVTLSLQGLEDSKMYNIYLDIMPADNRRYKFINNTWMPVGKADQEIVNQPYLHLDSPSTGSFWKKTRISFAKLKITNNRDNESGNIIVHSMHKYMAKIRIVPVVRENSNLIQYTQDEVAISLPITTFMAVTAYQNDQITQMKIANNPFAKAFRDAEVTCLLQNSSPLSTLYSPSSETLAASQQYMSSSAAAMQTETGPMRSRRHHRSTPTSYTLPQVPYLPHPYGSLLPYGGFFFNNQGMMPMSYPQNNSSHTVENPLTSMKVWEEMSKNQHNNAQLESLRAQFIRNQLSSSTSTSMLSWMQQAQALMPHSHARPQPYPFMDPGTKGVKTKFPWTGIQGGDPASLLTEQMLGFSVRTNGIKEEKDGMDRDIDITSSSP